MDPDTGAYLCLRLLVWDTFAVRAWWEGDGLVCSDLVASFKKCNLWSFVWFVFLGEFKDEAHGDGSLFEGCHDGWECLTVMYQFGDMKQVANV